MSELRGGMGSVPRITSRLTSKTSQKYTKSQQFGVVIGALKRQKSCVNSPHGQKQRKTDPAEGGHTQKVTNATQTGDKRGADTGTEPTRTLYNGSFPRQWARRGEKKEKPAERNYTQIMSRSELLEERRVCVSCVSV